MVLVGDCRDVVLWNCCMITDKCGIYIELLFSVSNKRESFVIEMADKKSTYADVCKKSQPKPVPIETKVVKQTPIQRRLPREEYRKQIDRSMNEDICCFLRGCCCVECDFMHASGETYKQWQQRMQEKKQSCL